MKRWIWVALTVLLAAGSAGAADAHKLRVVASFTVLADIARQIGGSDVEVVSLVPPNGDPHAYEPTPEDARQLHAADLVLVNGMGLEGWMDRLIAAAGPHGPVVVASTGIGPLMMNPEGQAHGQPVPDPHAWNSAANGEIYARNVEMALARGAGDDAAAFHDRAQALRAALHALDEEARTSFAAIPPERRKVLTTHDAFGYFARAYGVTFLSPLGLTTDTEPSAKTVAMLIQQIRAEHITRYFLENSNDPRLLRQIADATGAQPGGELYVESLSPPGGPAATYLDMFRHNMNALLAAMRSQ